MSRVIRVVIVEGQAAEAERLESALRRSGLEIETHRVATRRALVDAVERGEPDVILWGDEPPEVAELLSVPAIKAVRLRGPEATRELAAYASRMDLFVLDSYRPGAYGGTGEVGDWALAASVAAE